jgi:hypothetical protein
MLINMTCDNVIAAVRLCQLDVCRAYIAAGVAIQAPFPGSFNITAVEQFLSHYSFFICRYELFMYISTLIVTILVHKHAASNLLSITQAKAYIVFSQL